MMKVLLDAHEGYIMAIKQWTRWVKSRRERLPNLIRAVEY